MAKSQQVRLLEKQIKQDKNAERKREQEARQEAIRMRAASVVNGQPFVAGFRIMDATAEEVLKCLLGCKNGESNRIEFDDRAMEKNEKNLFKIFLNGMMYALKKALC